MKKVIFLLLAAVMIAGCSHSKTATTTTTTGQKKTAKPVEVYKYFTVKYKIVDDTECNGTSGKGEFYISISDEYAANSDVEVHDINPQKNEYRYSGKIETSYRFSNYNKKKYTVTLLDKNLFNVFVTKAGKFAGSFFKFPGELLDDYLDEYEFCARVTIQSDEIFGGEKKYYMKNSKGKVKVVIYALGQ